MTYGKFEISHQEYDRLQAMEYSQRRVEIKSMIPDSIKVGNGLYGYATRIIDGKCYIAYVCGDSCD